MKNLFFIYLILFLVSGSTIGQESNTTLKKKTVSDPAKTATEDNKTLIRRYFQEVWNEADLKVVEEVTPEPFVLHFQGQPIVATHKEHQDVVQYWLNGFPDYKVTIQDVIAEEDKVVARYTFTGTHQGEVLGISPTANKIEVGGIWICRVENGLLTECWEEYDEQGLRNQLQKE